MIGYTCAWCGGGHLGVDCDSRARWTCDSRMGEMAVQYIRAERLVGHTGRLRKLVVAHQEKPCEVCIDLARLENVIGQLKKTEACVAAVVEGQNCGAVVTARWAARELRRMVAAWERET